jgi:hypothetical protein
MADLSAQKRFSAGDTISIGMDFEDENGVDEVYVLFVNTENYKHTVGLRAYGGGSTRLKTSVQAPAASDLAPEEYRCEYIHVRDVHGNYAVSYPDQSINFWVDGSGRPTSLAVSSASTPVA